MSFSKDPTRAIFLAKILGLMENKLFVNDGLQS